MGEEDHDLRPSDDVAQPETLVDHALRDIMDAPLPPDPELGAFYTVLGVAMNGGRDYADYSAYLQNAENRKAIEDLLVSTLHDKGEAYRPIIVEMLDALTRGDAGYLPDPWQYNIGEGADPVLLASGEFVFIVEDLHIDGAGIDFVFRRTYRNQVVYAGPLGANWDHAYNLRLREREGELILTSGDLRQQRFRAHPLHAYFVPPDGVDAIVQAEGASFVRRAADGIRHIFAPDPGAAGQHRLARIEDRFGRFLRFHYVDVEGSRLDRVEVNHPARVVRFGYDAQGRIATVTDYTGRMWRYCYDDMNDLVAITTPATDLFPAGLTTTYEYSTGVTTGLSQHNLRRVTDASGRLYLENEYGETVGGLDYNRVVRQRQAGGETMFEYEEVEPVFAREYPDAQRPTTATTVTERNGQRVCHVFNRFGNQLSRKEFVLESGQIRLLTEHYRYNRDGQLTAALSPTGALTQYLYGREDFVRRHAIATDDETAVHDALTPEVRLGFGRILSTVRRAKRFDLLAATISTGVWGDFPDIIGGFDQDDEDIIVKTTYEPDYGQVLTMSDPRFTRSASHAALEHPRYQETLTRYVYAGPAGDPHLFLVEAQRPTATRPDGTSAAPVVERFQNGDGTPAYNARGRPTRRTSARGVVTAFEYVAESAGDPRSGHLSKVVNDPENLAVTTTFEVDALGRVTATRRPRGQGASDDAFVQRFVYDELDQLVENIGVPPFRFRTRRTFDRTGRVTRMEYPLLDEHGQPILGGIAVRTFCYDEDLRLVAESVGGMDRATRLVTRHGYDSAGLRRLTVLPAGNRLAYRHDERQLRRATIQGAGTADAAISRLEYDADRRLRRTIDPGGQATTYTLDPFGRIVAEENALGHVVRRDYDKLGHKVCERFFERRAEGYVLLARNETNYDELGRAIRHGVNRFALPLGSVTGPQVPTAFRDSPGPGELLSTLVFYDGDDLVVGRIDVLGRSVTLEYNALDRVSASTDAEGTRLENTYDAHGNLVRSDRMEVVRDSASGAPIGRRAFATEYEYDEADRMVASRDNLGNTTRYAYDSRGNVVDVVDPLGRLVRTEYDLFNRAVAVRQEPPPGDPTPPRVTRTEYDANGNITVVVDTLGRRTEHRYDQLDRRIATVYPDGSAARVVYHADSHVAEVFDANGLRRRFTIDALGRTVRIEVDRTGLPAGLIVEGAEVHQFVFDGLNRPIRETNDFADREVVYNSLGWPEQEVARITGPAAFGRDLTIERQFDAAGGMVGLTYPEGRRLRFTRDGLDRLTAVRNEALGTPYPGSAAAPATGPIAAFAYAGLQLAGVTAGNGVPSAYRYDAAGRPIEIIHAPGSPQPLAIQYLYDGAGQIRLRHDVTGAGAPAERFTNDAGGWLIQVQQEARAPFDPDPLAPPSDPLPHPVPDRQSTIDAIAGPPVGGGDPHLRISYDDVGNREREERAETGAVAYEVNALDQYTARANTVVRYDFNGNVVDDGVRRYVYDAEDRLVRIIDAVSGTDVARFFHDVRGSRILELIDTTSTHLLWDGDELLAEYRDGELARQYVHGDGTDSPLQIAAGGTEHFCHADLGGSIRRLSGPGGEVTAAYRYDPFGIEMEATGPAADNLLRYCGRRLDVALDTYDYRARQYDPRLGRFLQRDPAGMRDGTNLYTYAGNDPIRFRDPTGLGRSEHESEYVLEPEVGLIAGRNYIGADGMPWRFQDGSLTYAGDDGMGYCFDRGTSAGAFGWRIREPGNTNPPRSTYTVHTAAEHALRGEYNMAEIAEAKQACFYCHVQRTFGRTPSDDEFDLRVVSEDVLFYTDVQMGIMSAAFGAAGGLSSTTRAVTTIPLQTARTTTRQALRTTARAGSTVGRRTPAWRKLSRSFWEDRRTFNVSKNFFKRWSSVFRNQRDAVRRWSGEHMLIKQRWYRGANPVFRPGTWQNRALQGLGDAGWNIVPMPHRLNQFLYNHKVLSLGFTGGVYYGAAHVPGAAWDAGLQLRGWVEGESDE